MIRAIIQDIGAIVDTLQKKYTYGAIVYHLITDVEHLLHNAFLDGRIDDFTVKVSRGPDLIHLKVQVKEDIAAEWEYLGFVIDKNNTRPDPNMSEAYDRAMKGV